MDASDQGLLETASAIVLLMMPASRRTGAKWWRWRRKTKAQ